MSSSPKNRHSSEASPKASGSKQSEVRGLLRESGGLCRIPSHAHRRSSCLSLPTSFSFFVLNSMPCGQRVGKEKGHRSLFFKRKSTSIPCPAGKALHDLRSRSKEQICQKEVNQRAAGLLCAIKVLAPAVLFP